MNRASIVCGNQIIASNANLARVRVLRVLTAINDRNAGTVGFIVRKIKAAVANCAGRVCVGGLAVSDDKWSQSAAEALLAQSVAGSALQALVLSVIVTDAVGYSLRAFVAAKGAADFANAAGVSGGSSIVDQAVLDGLHGHAGASSAEPEVGDTALAVSDGIGLPAVGLGRADTGAAL